MKFLLDTNVVSELWKPAPDAAVLAWFFQADWLLPVPVIAGFQEGVEAHPSAARRVALNAVLEELLEEAETVILPWDTETARTWGRLKHSPEGKRRPQSLWDSLIDAMATTHGAIVATRNKADFRHADTFNPWDYSE